MEQAGQPLHKIEKSGAAFDFSAEIARRGLNLKPLALEILQLNITKLCNQACRHCHVDASPRRKEQMSWEVMEQCLKVLEGNPSIHTVDLTGGAPELNPHFDRFVIAIKELGRHVIVRHNLTVTFDGNPQTRESKAYLPDFFALHKIEVVSSLPFYQEFFTDKQRGDGVFRKSIEGLKKLNALGYGQEGTGLVLNLVYNPVGAFLPPPQDVLEVDYKKELKKSFGIDFNKLFSITNMPIHRFKAQLLREGGYEEYLERLVNAFNPTAAAGIMCRTLISVSYDGKLFDCDFNQMLNMNMESTNQDHGAVTIFDFDLKKILQRQIAFASHCFGCTAGAGSSCGGVTTTQ